MSHFKKLFPYFFFSLVLLNIAIWYAVFSNPSSGKMTISFLNIGQGDAIFIEAPNGAQVLMDGGPGRSVLSELSTQMPFFDKSLDAIIITNPDKDHIGGFLDVMDKYKVDFSFEPGTISKTDTYHAVEDAITKEKSQRIIARRGMDIVLDKENNVYIRILFPDKDVSAYTTNDGSIVARLVYGKTSVLLEGDAPQKTENYLLQLNNKEDKENPKELTSELNSDILKTGHHGSRTSTAKAYVEASTPDYAVISCGIDNKYGHPHEETLGTLNALNVPILRTDTMGRITFVSDGEKFERK